MDRIVEPHRQRIWSALQRHKFQDAAMIRAAHEAAQPNPIGINVDWKNYDTTRDVAWLTAIWKGQPKILKGLKRSAVEPTRLAAAMSVLGDDPQQYVAEDLETGMRFDSQCVARQWVGYGHFIIEMAFLRRLPIKKVRVLGANDDFVCEACRALQAQTFDLARPPEIPHEHCTSDSGCRCIVAMVSPLG